MIEYFSMDISKKLGDELLFMRPSEGRVAHPKLVIHDELYILPRFGEEVREWINEHIMNPFYLVSMQDTGVDGICTDKNRIIFSDQQDYMYFKLKWS